MLAVMSHYVSWDRLQAIKKWGLPGSVLSFLLLSVIFQVLVVSGAQDNLVSSRNSKIVRHINYTVQLNTFRYQRL